MFDFGGVVDGYCSDFGRTIYCGEPPQEVRDVYDVMLAAHAAGLAAATAGTPACEVNAACRRPIEEAGLGEHFRHRMGHGIGMDVHERPFLSTEDETPLEPGMTFTDEPSIIVERPLRRPDRGHHRVRGGRGAQTQQLPHRPRRDYLVDLLRRDLRHVDVVLGVVDRIRQVTRRDEHLRRLHQREVRPALVQLQLDLLVEALPGSRRGGDRAFAASASIDASDPLGHPARRPTSWPGVNAR